MSSAIRSQKLWWLGSVLFVGLGFASGCAGKSEGSNGDGSGTSGAAGTTSNGGGGATTGGTGSISKGGCGPSAGSSGKGGGCGVSGTAGSGTGGAAGSATGGSAGSTSGGTSGSGGAAGEAGTAGMSGAECATPEDCQMVSDCCGCRADPKSAPTACLLPCQPVDACANEGIASTEVSCIMGRCVLARSCDRDRVTCRAAPPECPEGSLPSVVETCWGPCIGATECSWVTDCTDCGDAVCVEFQADPSSFSCVTPARGCNAGNYCECLGACDSCTEVPQGVACACPAC